MTRGRVRRGIALFGCGSAVLATVVLGGAGTAAAGPRCSDAGSTKVTGGYQVSLYCGAALGVIEGVGDNVTDARVQAQKLADYAAAGGPRCTADGTDKVTGGYLSNLFCNQGLGVLDGVGSNLTDAADEARALMRKAATGGPRCILDGVDKISGGYRVSLFCNRAVGVVDGVGTKLSAAARAARQAV